MHKQNLNHDNNNLNSSTSPQEMEANENDYQSIHLNDNIDEESPPPLPIQQNKSLLHSPSTWFFIFIGAIFIIFAIFAIMHFAPILMRKEVIPAIHWLVQSCNQTELAAIMFTAIALLPLILLPTVPLKWVVGMIFGYGFSVILIMCAVAVAVTLPYFIAYHFFLDRIQKWLENYPEKAAIVKLAGDGDWSHQFKAIILLRVSPFPYVILNYIAVVMDVNYSPYLAGSLVGIIPEVFFAIYSGRLLRRVAEAMDKNTHVSKFQMIFDAIGFCISATATVIIGFYSKRKLEQLQTAGK